MIDAFPYLVYAVFAVGAAGAYFALPRAGKSTGSAGTILGAAAVGLLIVCCVAVIPSAPGSAMSYLFGAVALLASGRVITHPKPVYCALYFVLVAIAVACIAVVQKAEFLGIALVIVYAGAILVTYAFVIMLAQQGGASGIETRSREPLAAVIVGFVTMAAIAAQTPNLKPPAKVAGDDVHYALAASQSEAGTARAAESRGGNNDESKSNTALVGASVLTDHMLTMQVAGLLLLIAMIGAIAISRKRVPSEESGASAAVPLGQVGKTAPPF